MLARQSFSNTRVRRTVSVLRSKVSRWHLPQGTARRSDARRSPGPWTLPARTLGPPLRRRFTGRLSRNPANQEEMKAEHGWLRKLSWRWELTGKNSRGGVLLVGLHALSHRLFPRLSGTLICRSVVSLSEVPKVLGWVE